MTAHKMLRAGCDPRSIPDYAALRDELGKLTHPARPDVNWHYAEKLCHALFEQNGVELQTAAWYTLARAHLAGASGLNEGLAILESLINHQWTCFWPQSIHVRLEILSELSQRLQQRIRTLDPDFSDVRNIYDSEQQVMRLVVMLKRMGIRRLNQLEILRTMMHNSAVRLENSEDTYDPGAVVQSGIFSPVTTTNDAGSSGDALSASRLADKNGSVNAVKWGEVVQPRNLSEVEVPAAVPATLKKLKIFVAGMCTALLLGGVGLWSFQQIYPGPAIPLPVIPNEESLKGLEQMSPLWLQDYGFSLAARASPGEAEKLQEQWQQDISGNALPAESLSGWHQGMEGLEELTRRLNALDERKGKYLTGSELKSMVFAITQNFRRAPPLEERLYQLSLAQNGDPLSAAQIVQTDYSLNQLLNRYALLKRQIKP